MKLVIDVDETQIELLKEIKKYDGTSDCIGDVVRRLIYEEARRLRIAPTPSMTSSESIMEQLLNIMSGKR